MKIEVYQTKPAHFNHKQEIAGCLLECCGKFLLVKRAKEVICPNLWNLPAGKIEKGETAQMAAIREMKEELGVVIKNLKFLETIYMHFDSYDQKFHVFYHRFTKMPEILLEPTECSDLKWVSFSEMDILPLIPGGKKTLLILKKSLQENLEKPHYVTSIREDGVFNE